MIDSAVLGFLNSIFLQIPGLNPGPLGSTNPLIPGTIGSVFGIVLIAIGLNFLNAIIRKKMVDQEKIKRLLKETRAWQKERMAAFRAKDQEKIDQLNKKSAYMNKMNMEVMQSNMRPMMITFVPFLLVFYLVLPHLFSYTVALSPIPLDIVPGNFFHLTCTAEDIVKPEHICTQANQMYLWSWYFLSSIAVSGIIMRVTKTSMSAD